MRRTPGALKTPKKYFFSLHIFPEILLDLPDGGELFVEIEQN